MLHLPRFPLVLALLCSAPTFASPTDKASTAVAPMMAARDFKQLQGGPEHRGQVDVPPITKPRIRWSGSVGIQGYLNAPVVQGKTVLVPSSGTIWNKPDPTDGLYALDVATGRRRWHFETQNDANGVGLHPGMNLAVVTSDDDHVYAVDLTTGKLRWKHKGKGKMYTHPLVLGDLIVVGDGGGTLWALNPTSGTVVFKHNLRGSLRGGAASDGKVIYAATTQGDTLAVDLAGKVRWRKTLMRPGWDGEGEMAIEAYAAPTVVGDLLILSFARDTTYNTPALIALDRKTGANRWRGSTLVKSSGDFGNLRTSPVVVQDQLIYAEPYSGDVLAVDLASGRMTRRQQVGECMFPHWASPVAARDMVYVPRFDGALVALDARSLKRQWALYLGDKAKTGRQMKMTSSSKWGCAWEPADKRSLYATPALAADGTLFVGNGHNTLFAIEPAR